MQLSRPSGVVYGIRDIAAGWSRHDGIVAVCDPFGNSGPADRPELIDGVLLRRAVSSDSMARR
jgi:hypothetical protein